MKLKIDLENQQQNRVFTTTEVLTGVVSLNVARSCHYLYSVLLLKVGKSKGPGGGLSHSC